MNLFCAENLTAAYSGTPVLRDVCFEAEAGGITGILGANGCGKTTLLKAICGAIPHGGRCTLAGTTLEGLSARKIARLCSYIPQRSGIHIDISALDVVLMGFNPRLALLQQPDAAMRQCALDALEHVGLGNRTESNYQTLSEGQKQLCILARTLVSDAKLLLLDEPESALDFRYRHRMLAFIRDWVQTGERCAVLTLHDPQLALEYCDRLLMLREGRITGVLHPAQDDPAFMESALRSIYGEINLLRCTDRSGGEHTVLIREGGISR